MPQVSRVNVDSAGGLILGGGGAGYKIAGQIIAVIGDAVAVHPPAPPHSTAPSMVTGQSNYRVNGTPVCRAGDAANCGHSSTGSTTFSVA